jgi:hypothetical protein
MNPASSEMVEEHRTHAAWHPGNATGSVHLHYGSDRLFRLRIEQLSRLEATFAPGNIGTGIKAGSKQETGQFRRIHKFFVNGRLQGKTDLVCVIDRTKVNHQSHFVSAQGYIDPIAAVCGSSPASLGHSSQKSQ